MPLLEASTRRAIPAVDDMAKGSTLVIGFSDWRLPGGEMTPVFVVGSDLDHDVLNPCNIAEGSIKVLSAPQAVAIDRSYDKRLGMSKLGEKAEIRCLTLHVAALDDAVAAYRWLLADRGDPRRIAVIGDSAAGGLALALLLKARDDDLPLPAAAGALSPWTDLALTGASLRLNAQSDPMLNADDVPAFAADYLAGADPRNPYASPLYGDPNGLPPTLIQVGDDEILLDDAERMADRMRRANCDVELQIWPRTPHVWQMLAPVLPEARGAIVQVGTFVERMLQTRASAGP